ncbi:MAG: EpsG family protein [Oscillospiraceae bacterium]|nr:EpsG family protein [Oscillospiraceae bacterium]
MAVYAISLAVIIFIFIFLKVLSPYIRDFDKTFLVAEGSFLVILSGLRSCNVGTDVLAYKYIFETFGASSLTAEVTGSFSQLTGYRLLCRAVYSLSGGNYQVMLLISAAIIIYGFFKFIYYYSDNCAASFFYYISLYYFFFSWNAVRQSMAMSVCLLAICSLDMKRYKRALLYAVLSVAMHNVVIIIYIYLLLRKIKWNRIIFLIYTAALAVAMLFTENIIMIFCRIFPRYTIYLNKLLIGDYSTFGGETGGRKIILSIAFLMFILIAFCFFKDEMFQPLSDGRKIEGVQLHMENLWTFMAAAMIEVIIGILYSTNSFYLRVQTVFSVFSVFLLPAVVQRFDRNKDSRSAIYVISVILFFITTGVRMKLNHSGIYPYEFFFSV